MPRGHALGVAFTLFISCAHSAPIERPPHPLIMTLVPIRDTPRTDAVILVTIDGARWQEIFSGTDGALSADAHVRAKSASQLMPTLARWMTADGAAIGAPGHGEMHATGPNYVSLPGYTEILSGRSPTDCQSNDCADTRGTTVLDEVALAYEGDAVAVVSSWDAVGRAATANNSDRITLSTGRARAHGLPDAWLASGSKSAPWPGDGAYRPDVATMELALHVVREQEPRLMFVALGDTDEHAHHGDYAGYLRALEAADAFLGELEKTTATSGRATSILVTCDHGRAADFRDHGAAWPESGRVWLVAHGAGIVRSGIVDVSRPTRLADVAPTVRVLLGIAPDDDARAGKPLEALFLADATSAP